MSKTDMRDATLYYCPSSEDESHTWSIVDVTVVDLGSEGSQSWTVEVCDHCGNTCKNTGADYLGEI